MAGWTRLKHDIEDLAYLERLGRINREESALLAEYRQLMDQILVLPGFEFTATFGFHILAVFDPTTSIRMMEHLLLSLGIPEQKIGSGEVGATSDVLRAYEVLADHGGLVIGAHVNSTHGIAMRNIRFGGQTKIAYTQDEHLHALEVTDLMTSSARSTARFYSGIKAEYPRRMHCIQGSDSHRLRQDPNRPTNLGIGDRVTEFYLPERTFAALKACLQSSDWDRVRPARPGGPQATVVHSAREAGPSQQIALYERLQGGAKSSVAAVVRDTVAFANGSGGTILIGVGAANRRTVPGVADVDKLHQELQNAVQTQIEPVLNVEFEPVPFEGKTLLSIKVPPGDERPYALAGGDILVRRGAETAPARRDEIVRLVKGEAIDSAPVEPAREPQPKPERQPAQRTRQERQPRQPEKKVEQADRIAPRNGVEIVEVNEQDGVPHYAMRDLRNNQVTRNVTSATARSLWAQAIREYERGAPSEESITWAGDFGLWKSVRISNGERRFHLVARTPEGTLRYFFGVSEDAMDERWLAALNAAREPAMAESQPGS